MLASVENKGSITRGVLQSFCKLKFYSNCWLVSSGLYNGLYIASNLDILKLRLTGLLILMQDCEPP